PLTSLLCRLFPNRLPDAPQAASLQGRSGLCRMFRIAIAGRRRAIGAGGETRTHTSLRRTDFESVASTGSATPASASLYRQDAARATGIMRHEARTGRRPGRPGQVLAP